MSTNPLERIPKRSPKTGVTDLNEFAKTAGSTAASAAYPIMLGLTGEELRNYFPNYWDEIND